MKISTFLFRCFFVGCVQASGHAGTHSQDQTSPRANTLFDDPDDIQKQLDNEARDRNKFGKRYLRRNFATELKCFEDYESLPKWEYKDQNNWGKDYPFCDGTSQSPVDLPHGGLPKAREGRKMIFSNYDVKPKNMALVNDGKGITLYGDWPKSKRPIIYGGAAHSRCYIFHSLALHWPSEHTIGGLQFPLESQALYVSSVYGSLDEALNASMSDHLALLSVANLYKYSHHTHKGLKDLLQASAKASFGNNSITPQPLSHFQPTFTEYATYHGSLTMPPCTESVHWFVRARPLPVTRIDLINHGVYKYRVNKYHPRPLHRFPSAEHISKLRPSQSPIAISLNRCPTWSSLDPLKFKGYWDNKAKGILLNNGSTAYFAFETPVRPTLSGGPLLGDYIFEQMHFHWSVDDFTGCEHVLDGHGFAAECHFVHYNSKYESLEAAVGHPDGLAVVGFLFEAVDAPNPRFDKLVQGLDGIKKKESVVHVTSDSLSWMDRADLYEGSYVTYKGSLTTPPYTECVTWIIYEKPVQIGTEQLSLLRQLEGHDNIPIERNVRPTQRHPPGHSVIYVKQVKAKL